MSAKYTKRSLTARRRGLTDLEHLRNMSDADIDYSDIPPLDEDFWKHAKLVMPPGKERVSLHLDHYILDYFRSQGKGYQTRINTVLGYYVDNITQEKRT